MAEEGGGAVEGILSIHFTVTSGQVYTVVGVDVDLLLGKLKILLDLNFWDGLELRALWDSY